MAPDAIARDPNPSGYAQADDTQVRSALLNELRLRLDEHQQHSTAAVVAFANSAGTHIDALKSGEAEYEFGPVVSAIGGAMKVVFPEIKWIETVTELMELGSSMAEIYSQNFLPQVSAKSASEARDKLHVSVATLVDAYTRSEKNAWEATMKKLDDLVTTVLSDLPGDGMTVRPEWIKQLADYAGIPEATGTYDTVRQKLELEFLGVYEQVDAELHNSVLGHGGEASPTGWADDAMQEEQKLYAQEGEGAWSHVYEEIAWTNEHGGVLGEP